jgi:hypothetical protein
MALALALALAWNVWRVIGKYLLANGDGDRGRNGVPEVKQSVVSCRVVSCRIEAESHRVKEQGRKNERTNERIIPREEHIPVTEFSSVAS